MRSLLDASVLIAYFDLDHLFHDQAYRWFKDNMANGWSTCPLTENACLRVLSNPGYSAVRRYVLPELIEKLNETILGTNHVFWPDDISLRDMHLISSDFILGSRQITDVYLLALAVRNKGRLVTFDERINLAAVSAATSKNLCII